MTTFDATDRENCTVRQVRTNTPLQALNLMNDVAYVEASRLLGQRMMQEGGSSPEARIAYGFHLTTARSPKPEESEVLLDSFNRFELHYQSDPQAALELLSEGKSPRDQQLDAPQLAAYSSVASLILNLDEVITKQ